MKSTKKKRQGITQPSQLAIKDYSVQELIELGEKNNKIELANPSKTSSIKNVKKCKGSSQ